LERRIEKFKESKEFEESQEFKNDRSTKIWNLVSLPPKMAEH
jgi:hypothetical protein